MWMKALREWLAPYKRITAEQLEDELRVRRASYEQELWRAQIPSWHLPPY